MNPILRTYRDASYVPLKPPDLRHAQIAEEESKQRLCPRCSFVQKLLISSACAPGSDCPVYLFRWYTILLVPLLG